LGFEFVLPVTSAIHDRPARTPPRTDGLPQRGVNSVKRETNSTNVIPRIGFFIRVLHTIQECRTEGPIGSVGFYSVSRYVKNFVVFVPKTGIGTTGASE